MHFHRKSVPVRIFICSMLGDNNLSEVPENDRRKTFSGLQFSLASCSLRTSAIRPFFFWLPYHSRLLYSRVPVPICPLPYPLEKGPEMGLFPVLTLFVSVSRTPPAPLPHPSRPHCSPGLTLPSPYRLEASDRKGACTITLYSDVSCLQTFLLIFKFASHWTIAYIVSTANKPLVGTLMTIGDVTRNIAIQEDDDQVYQEDQ